MLDMGWSEILLIGVMALIVVGPKDLPRMLRTFGQFVGKMRGMARDFQRSMDDAAREADMNELKGIKDALNDVRSVQSDAASAIRKGLNNIDREVEKSADLRAEDIDLDAPVTVGKVEKIGRPEKTGEGEREAPARPAPGPAAAPAVTAAPATRAASPGDPADEPAPAVSEARTASGT